MLRLAIAAVLVLASKATLAREFEKDFAVYLAGEETLARLGPLPLPRALIAKAIDHAAQHDARGVVIKLFLDQARSMEDDLPLASSMRKLPVALQARIDDAEAAPNPFEARFALADTSLHAAISGTRGWIPTPVLAKEAHSICFVDFDGFPVPLLEHYGGLPVKSLVTCAIEMATDEKVRVSNGRAFHFGQEHLRVDDMNQFTDRKRFSEAENFRELADLIEGQVSAQQIAGRVIIIGYDSSDMATVSTPTRPLRLHRAFAAYLKTIYEDLR
ncbi:CHASE2 domain-containing protein [Inhella proteolytica]|uniref:CHASE2 domain-containing protein n=1 Tax=Inhella proteolytica TaxID=2795029 RepID=A0A931J471_9BURK|nr:CHASE2 domain-containing protein [Inhella proteolytica]MBH9578438.1 CHASE2 domain-containing protein [Inhella proteolytica]